jgi:hypothetical protein
MKRESRGWGKFISQKVDDFGNLSVLYEKHWRLIKDGVVINHADGFWRDGLFVFLERSSPTALDSNHVFVKVH